MKNLDGKVAFVTGGASGMGLAMVRSFLAAGMKVVAADVEDAALAKVRAEFSGSNAFMAIKLDVTDRAAMARAADDTERAFGKVHVLCNNAGVVVSGRVDATSYSDWDWVLGVNLGGVVNGLQTFIERIKKHGEGGHIVNTASMSGLMPHPGATIYGTSKGAAVHMMECMRAELEPVGIICSAFCPGAVQSNIAEAARTRPAQLSETGYAEADKRRQAGGNFSHLYMTKEAVGQRVLQGILNDELYILTHSEFRQGVEERAQAMCAAVPDLPENPEYKNTFSILFRNPIHAAEAARQKGLKT